ncbi:MAG: zinc ribbon domain-containing protein [Candidatus Acidiferrales bacterium]
MNASNPSLGHQVAERLVRTSIAIMGLLILRGILSLLPMLRTNPVYVASVLGAAFDPQSLANPDQLHLSLTQAQIQALEEEFQKLQRQNSFPASDSVAEALRLQNDYLIAAHLAIFPITIAKAVIDTLIFALLILFGFSLASLFRSHYARLPDLGQMMNLCIVTVVVGISYYSYQGLAYPFLYPDDLEIYGWTFLGLVLAPLVGLAVVVARNMDSITAMIMHSGTAVTPVPATDSVRCSVCGHTVELGTRFCPQCGSAMSAPAALASPGHKACSSCGTDNPGTAKFCKGCGGALAA